MSESRPSLFARLFSRLDPRLSFSLVAGCLFLLLIATSNLFAAYAAAVEQNFQVVAFRVGALLFYAIPAIGILKMKNWARLLGIFLCTIATLLGLLTFFAGDNIDGAFIILTHGSVLFCLLSKKTRTIFATRSP